MSRPKNNLEQNLAEKVRSRELLGGELDSQEKHIRALLKEKLAGFPGVISFAVVGSRALGYALPESDFDVLVLTDRPFTKIAPYLDKINLETDAKNILNSSAKRLFNRISVLGPYPLTANSQKIELWFRNVNSDYLQNLLDLKDYPILGMSYQALFNPLTHQSRKIKEYRTAAVCQFQSAFRGNDKTIEAILKVICESIASMETYNMHSRIKHPQADNPLLYMEPSKFQARTGKSREGVDAIYAQRVQLWYCHLSKYLLSSI